MRSEALQSSRGQIVQVWQNIKLAYNYVLNLIEIYNLSLKASTSHLVLADYHECLPQLLQGFSVKAQQLKEDGVRLMNGCVLHKCATVNQISIFLHICINI